MNSASVYLKPEAERSIIGGVLLSPESYTAIAPTIQPEDFGTEAHRLIFIRAAALLEATGHVDLITLVEALTRHKELQKVGDVGYVSSLIDGVPDRANLSHYVAIVKESARKRRLAALCEAMTNRLEDPGINSGAVMDSILDTVYSIQANAVKAEGKSIFDLMPGVLEGIKRQRGTQDILGGSTGIENLDRATGGIRDGELWVIGALPGRGKTPTGLQFAMEAAKDTERGAVFFSLEMSADQLLRRGLARAQTRITATQIRDPRYLTDPEFMALCETGALLAQRRLIVDDVPDLSIREITARAKLYKQRYNISTVVVDYLQLVRAAGKEKRDQVGNAANGLRILARKEQLRVIALSQLRRPKDINDRPDMIQLKESGDVEAHANTVLLLYMPIEKQTGHFTSMDEVIIGKQREGIIGDIPVSFIFSRLGFFPRYTSEGQ